MQKKKAITTEEKSGNGQTYDPDRAAEWLPEIWQQLLRQIGPVLANELRRAALPAIIGPNTLVLSLSAAYNGLHQYHDHPDTVARIESCLEKLTHTSWKVRVQAAASEEASTLVDPESSPPSRPRPETLQEPLVKRALDLLRARVLQIDSEFGTSPAAPMPRLDETDSEET